MIIEARFRTKAHYALDFLRLNEFSWSEGQGCWWRLAPADEAERLRVELERLGILVSLKER